VIDDRGSGKSNAHGGGTSEIGLDDLDTGWKAGDRVAPDGPRGQPANDEFVDHRPADRAQTHDHVEIRL
jgi:hypothetical protein